MVVSDLESIQGCWKVMSHYLSGHEQQQRREEWWAFEGDRIFEIAPSEYASTSFRQYFELDESAQPKRVTIRLDWNGPDGPPDPNSKYQTAVYKLSGDDLQIWYAEPTDPDRALNDCDTYVLRRHTGPRPQSKPPSGTPDIVDNVLGTLVWKDLFECFERRFEINENQVRFNLSLTGKPEFADRLANRARVIIGNFQVWHERVTSDAADRLLGLKNIEWCEDDEPEVSEDEFKRRLTLVGIDVDDQDCICFAFNDDEMFYGHQISVRYDATDVCVSADI